MAADALDLGGAVKALRIAPEEQHRRVGGFGSVEQVEMGEQRLGFSIGFQGKTALTAGGLQKPVDAVTGEIRQGRAVARRSVERRYAKRAEAVQMIDEAGIDFGGQSAGVFNTATNQLAARSSDQRAHFWRTLFFVSAPDVNQARLF